jgi:allophanate hydrolase
MDGSLGGISLDLTTLARTYRSGKVTPHDVAGNVSARVCANGDSAVWICRASEPALQDQARVVARRRSAGESLPLYGIPFAVKDNIDVAGYPTTAGCPAFSYLAEQTAPVVRRLQDAGALFVGKTNLDQFATGLAGDRSPHGPCRNPFSADHITGGSSSGSAVAVAAGLVSFALGTDTAGSGRVPAGCNNIVGLKPAPGRLDTDGVVPACRSLDCISIFALTAEDALSVYEVAAGKTEPSLKTYDQGFTFAVPAPDQLEFFGDAGQQALFARAVAMLQKLGGRRAEIDFGPLQEAASFLYDGPWLAERLAGLRDFIAAHGADMHPVTRTVIEGGARYTAADVFMAFTRLKELRESCSKILHDADVLVVPTMPALPTLAEVQTDSIGWSRRLGYYTNFVNLLGWAALAVPAGFTERGLPGGITLIAPGGSESWLCGLGMAWQRSANLKLGATSHVLPEAPRHEAPAPLADGWARVAVAGAHLRGQSLHEELRRTGARFVRACPTAARYRFVALMNLKPPRPGLLCEETARGSVTVEVYDLPMAGFGALVASVAPPLAIGTIELADGEKVKGFLCESWAAATGRDITNFGGWAAFLQATARNPAHAHDAVGKRGPR